MIFILIVKLQKMSSYTAHMILSKYVERQKTTNWEIALHISFIACALNIQLYDIPYLSLFIGSRVKKQKSSCGWMQMHVLRCQQNWFLQNLFYSVHNSDYSHIQWNMQIFKYRGIRLRYKKRKKKKKGPNMYFLQIILWA